MEFLKSHYEKVLLSLVLLGLAVVAAMLPLKVGEPTNPLPPPPGKGGFEPANLTTNEAILAQLTNGTRTVLAGTNNLLNPVKWKRTPKGQIIKLETEEKVGIGVLIATNLTPLYFTASYEGTIGSGETMRYKIGVTHDEDPVKANRVMMNWPVALQERSENGGFTLLEAKGPRDNPTSLELDLTKYAKRISISKDNPFKMIQGYKVDLYYPPENRLFRDLRAKTYSHGESEYTVRVAGETNIIVAIETNEVKLASKATDMRVSIPVHAAP